MTDAITGEANQLTTVVFLSVFPRVFPVNPWSVYCESLGLAYDNVTDPGNPYIDDIVFGYPLMIAFLSALQHDPFYNLGRTEIHLYPL